MPSYYETGYSRVLGIVSPKRVDEALFKEWIDMEIDEGRKNHLLILDKKRELTREINCMEVRGNCSWYWDVNIIGRKNRTTGIY